jgi:hypothetical protein
MSTKRMNQIPTLSFCTVCKDHREYLQQTLKENLENNRLLSEIIDFVLCDFENTSRLLDWITEEFSEYLKTGYLKYYRIESPNPWNFVRAKNICHYLAAGDIIANLDSDNFTGPQGGRLIINRFMKHRLNILYHQFDDYQLDRNYGRIAVLKKHFRQIGGYNEQFDLPTHMDDLIQRLEHLGIVEVTNAEVLYCGTLNNSSYYTTNQTEQMLIHKSISQQNIMEGRVMVDNPGYGICENIFDLSDNLILLQ